MRRNKCRKRKYTALTSQVSTAFTTYRTTFQNQNWAHIGVNKQDLLRISICHHQRCATLNYFIQASSLSWWVQGQNWGRTNTNILVTRKGAVTVLAWADTYNRAISAGGCICGCLHLHFLRSIADISWCTNVKFRGHFWGPKNRPKKWPHILIM